MFGLEMLDVAIGVIFIYLLLSLISSAVNELIEAWMKMRAVDLEHGIRELLNDPKGTGLAQQLYNHPLVYGLFRGMYDPAKIKKKRYTSGSNLPSYIPARNFALALLDIMLPAQPAGTTAAATLSGAADATVNATTPGIDTPDTTGNKPAIVVVQTTAKTDPKSVQQLREAVSLIENVAVRQALLTLIDAAGEDMNKTRENIENWYNSSMDRVAGWYKRRVQQIIFFIGLAIAIAVNADTIALVKSLASDAPMRNSLVMAAQEYAKTANSGDSPQEAEKRVLNNLKEIEKYGLPMGWDRANFRSIPSVDWPWPSLAMAWVIKALGWLITAVAISLGAPFWFDLLNKFMIIRSTVKPHEKSPEEGAVDGK